MLLVLNTKKQLNYSHEHPPRPPLPTARNLPNHVSGNHISACTELEEVVFTTTDTRHNGAEETVALDWHEPGVVIVLDSEIYVALVIVVFLSLRLLWSAEHDNADGDIASDGVTLQRAERRVKVRTRSHEDPIVVLTCR